jgi:leader peptidase (prepilin peptidase) / N-methyltransferase
MMAFAAGLFGLVVGSFLNVLILRRGAAALSGRSACLSCGTAIRWYDNIPVLSWFALRGRCRSCGSRISLQYPLVEATTGALFAAAAYALFPNIFAVTLFDLFVLVLHGAFIAILIAIAVYDMRHTIIPDAWAYDAALLGLAIALTMRSESLLLTLLSGPAAALPLFVLWYISKGRWMGLGDPKLALSIGFFLGPVFGPVAIMYAFIIGALVSVFVLLPLPYIASWIRKAGINGLSVPAQRFTMKSEVGFGPFLVASFFLVWFSLLYNVTLPLLPL